MKAKTIRGFNLSGFLDVPVTDPDDARRRKLLNIILLGVALLSILILITSTVWYITNFIPGVSRQDALLLIPSGLAILITTIAVYFVNRSKKIPGWVSATIFLIFLCALMAGTDTASELAAGRSLFVWAIPVVLAAFLLRPWGGFVFVALVTAELLLLAKIGNDAANPTAIVGFILLAGISWLAARGLEQALTEVRQVNANLDHLVQERTQALEDALIRERVALGQFQATLESLRDGVIVFDQNGRALVANPAAAHLFDSQQGELLTRPIAELIGSRILTPQDRGALLSLLTTDIAQPVNRRIRWGRQYLSVWSAPVYGGASTNRMGTVVLFQDITVEVEAEKMKDIFLATTSHELRTPINSILGYTDIMLNGLRGPMTDIQNETMARISRNAQRLFELVGDLLDQAQIQAGTLKIAPALFEISTIVEEVRSNCYRPTHDKGLSLITSIEKNVPKKLFEDGGRIRQVISNLVTNAIKFTEKGSVNVRVFCPDKKYWAIEVADTGIGIPEDKLSNIFDPFYQADSSLTRKVGGFGLGLAIVKNLVEMMNGTVRVASEIGAGSTFTVILPIRAVKRTGKG